jgi:hypothetical protein
LQPPSQRTTGAARTPRKEHPPSTAPTTCAKHSPAVTKQPRVLDPNRRWICASPLSSGQRALQRREPRKEHAPSTASTTCAKHWPGCDKAATSSRSQPGPIHPRPWPTRFPALPMAPDQGPSHQCYGLPAWRIAWRREKENLPKPSLIIWVFEGGLFYEKMVCFGHVFCSKFYAP